MAQLLETAFMVYNNHGQTQRDEKAQCEARQAKWQAQLLVDAVDGLCSLNIT